MKRPSGDLKDKFKNKLNEKNTHIHTKHTRVQKPIHQQKKTTSEKSDAMCIHLNSVDQHGQYTSQVVKQVRKVKTTFTTVLLN